MLNKLYLPKFFKQVQNARLTEEILHVHSACQFKVLPT